MEKTNKTKPKTFLDDSDIPLWKIRAFIKKYENGKDYKEDCKDAGEDPNSQFDQGFDHALDLLEEELKEIARTNPYK